VIRGWEAGVEAQIRTALERGDFDNLPGAGKPLPGRNEPYDEMWWIKSFLERESLPTDLLLPTPLLLRKKIEQIPDEVRDLPSEESVRALVGDLNAQIVHWLRNPIGPRVAVRPVDVDAVVRQWRSERATAAPAPSPAAPPGGQRPVGSHRWWPPWRDNRRRPRP
jgi:Domain of unknown function (DUF1992)